MRKITADRILLPDGQLHTDVVLVFSDTGTVIERLSGSEVTDTEKHDGILVPGFINTHCHLELSHLKGIISRSTGLPGFLGEVVSNRHEDDQAAEEAAQRADAFMWIKGVQGVGDICNRNHTVEVKARSNIRYFNFIETFGLDSRKADSQFRQAVGLCEEFERHSLAASVTAHAAYSMSPLLLDLIRVEHPLDVPWSVHNQESEDEEQLFSKKTGKLASLFASMGIDLSSLPENQGNSLHYLLRYTPSTGNLLFVHNTFTKKSDLESMREAGIFDRSWFALCPQANLYIENRLPDIMMLYEEGCNITVGTDSLASNDSLDIISELKAIYSKYPSINAGTLLTWATKNGADYFGWNDLGVFENGRNPGCVLIPTEADAEDVLNWGAALRLL